MAIDWLFRRKQGTEGTTMAKDKGDEGKNAGKRRDPCEKKRPEKGMEGTQVTEVKWKLGQLPEEMPVAMVVYPGCIEGDRVVYSVRGDDRRVLLEGTALQIAQYSIGDRVTFGDQTYCRNIGRKHMEAVQRIRAEITGTGEDLAAVMRERQNGQYGGFTLTANGTLVTKDSLLNGYFVEKDTPKAGDQAEEARAMELPPKYLGGVELVVSAIITPGAFARVYVPNAAEVRQYAGSQQRVQQPAPAERRLEYRVR